ncbi:MAG TPA: peptidase C39 family protein [Xanthobacteraceae bacterium]|nr:peptidase C39 family protein [Xanthobacteraceae bacterium]
MRTAARASEKAQPLLRPARPEDVPALLAIERRTFKTDRLSARSLQKLLHSPSSCLIVAELLGAVAGYAAVLFRAGSYSARLYSIAVDPACARQGIGSALLDAAEAEALARDCLFMRLEVGTGNRRAARLYAQAGYREIARIPAYYGDGSDALRLEKWLASRANRLMPPPPYFHQTTDFTCGPACIMMAMAWAGLPIEAGPALEYKLWREATTIFMASGLGGCGPFGLAVTLKRRGLDPEVHVSHPGPYFLDGVRSQEKRRVMGVAQAEFRREAESLGIPVHLEPLDLDSLCRALDSGACAIVLVTGYHLSRGRVPHWVFVYGHAERRILLHDPEAERDEAGRPKPSEGWAVPEGLFQRMSRTGADELRAAIVIRKGRIQ